MVLFGSICILLIQKKIRTEIKGVLNNNKIGSNEIVIDGNGLIMDYTKQVKTKKKA